MSVRLPLLTWAFLFSTAGAADVRPPNFVLIVADDLGYADLSSYGNDRFETPHLDALAREGLQFTDFHANGPVCSPTRAALLTGRYQQRSGVTEVIFADPARGLRETHGLPPEETTFAELLAAAGYRTALFGKWHLGYAEQFHPQRQGFAEFRGFLSGNVDYHTHFDQAGFFDWWEGREQRDEPGYTTQLITRHAVRFLEEHRDRPFCLYLAHAAPHSPYQGPDDPPVRGPGRQPPLRNPPDIQRAYREMVQTLDAGVGEVIAALRRLEIDRCTLVFFCSDNGGTREGNNGPLRGSKGTLWEGGQRVPAIAWWPGTIPPGVTHQTALTMDLTPTLLELAHIPRPTEPPLDGVSLAPLLRSGADLPERTVFWSYGNQRAARQGPWKLLMTTADGARTSGGRRNSPVPELALFRLDHDLGEQQDLSRQAPSRVETLRAALTAWERSWTNRPGGPASSPAAPHP